MILFILPLIALAVPTILGGIDYLLKLLFPASVPSTAPLTPPYIPPFVGGQCNGVLYRIGLKVYNSSGVLIVNTLEYGSILGAITPISANIENQVGELVNGLRGSNGGSIYGWRVTSPTPTRVQTGEWIITPPVGVTDNCGDVPNPISGAPIGGGGLAQSPPPVLYPPPNTNNNNLFPLIAGLAAVAATALTAATAAAAATAATAVTAATAASTAAAAAIASAPSGSTTQQQAQSQKLSADALVGIAQILAEVAKQIAELEKEVRKLKTDEAKKEKDDAKKVVRYDFGSANRDGFIKLYPESNPDGFEATFVDVQIFNIPSGSGKYFGEKSPHYYKYKSLGQIHFVSPTFGILESREIDFARLSLNVPDNCFGFFYHFGLDGSVSANLSCFYTKTEKQSV